MNIQFGHKPITPQAAQPAFDAQAGKPILKPLPVAVADSFTKSAPASAPALQFGASCCG